MTRIFGIFILAAEAAIAAYAVFMSYLLTAWMETDSFAAQATDRDWWIEGGRRLIIVGLGALFAASIARVGNEHLFRLLGFPIKRMNVYSAVAIFIFMVAAGVIGSIKFVITRSFM